ncbi:M20/M25/M40 family metallo-hydrolase [Rhodoligotrophos defluvii]|uniref:M20/M25/M40 family metallo-hydrolase n=1 Tax=Rhodoligotrophos defluvii TaxID=2561934 RepID=UPI0010C971AA|nr:M20/M25/M40 family metallo-hydrolase [Rhodoligotrophos defluvii]
MDLKGQLLEWIERDRDELIDFVCRFVRAKSPNPPGDTTEAVKVVTDFLGAKGVPFRLVDPQPTMANIVGTFEGGAPGRHLVLNGHIDVFPVDETEEWTHGPWSGAVADGKIWGRGIADMKCGTSASIFTYCYLHRLREHLKGKLTLTAVSDEETFGPWGARYLMEHHRDEVLGDCCLNGEPSGPVTLRFGEKGPLWIKFTVRTPGAHGSYTHLSPSATKIAAKLIHDLEAVTEIPTPGTPDIERALTEGEAAIERALGKGASKTLQRVTLNIGRINGGLKVNMIPGLCEFEADFRLPVGYAKEHILPKIREIAARYPEVTMEEINYSEAKACDPFGEMAQIIQQNVEALRGFKPTPIISMGGSDARLWRQRGVPAYIYGPYPYGMGQKDEYVDVEDFLHVVRTHVLSAFDYLSRG